MFQKHYPKILITLFILWFAYALILNIVDMRVNPDIITKTEKERNSIIHRADFYTDTYNQVDFIENNTEINTKILFMNGSLELEARLAQTSFYPERLVYLNSTLGGNKLIEFVKNNQIDYLIFTNNSWDELKTNNAFTFVANNEKMDIIKADWESL